MNFRRSGALGRAIDMGAPNISISIVSHGDCGSVLPLLSDLARLGRQNLEVVLTLNLPEPLPPEIRQLPFRLKLIENAAPKGFAANHNAAFALAEGEYFVLMNPDIRLPEDPFAPLLALFERTPQAICAPIVVNTAHEVEDSARNFPSPLFLCKKLLRKVLRYSFKPEVVSGTPELLMPDWVAGMFVMVPRGLYQSLHGLSERYHLYYEDVDFCARARIAGCAVLVSRRVSVVHNAQRTSHREWRYLLWHLQSAFKFFTSAAYLTIQKQRLFGERA